jgi:hypothetical protein
MINVTVINSFKNIDKKRILLYVIIYFLIGVIMNAIGKELEIAKFNNWWQIITCYVLYMVPISIALRDYSVFNQYAYGLIAMSVLEFGGYALETSYVYPNNLVIQYFGPYTFALGMSLFFALYFPLGNWLIDLIFSTLFSKKIEKNS